MIIQTEAISDVRHRVVSICYTMDELEGWIYVPEIPPIPEELPPKGKGWQLYYNPQNGELWYELIDVPLSREDRIAELEQVLADLASLLIEKGVLL